LGPLKRINWDLSRESTGTSQENPGGIELMPMGIQCLASVFRILVMLAEAEAEARIKSLIAEAGT